MSAKPITVIFPKDLLAQVDAVVAKRKETKLAPYKPSAAETQKAHVIAAKEGVAAANSYLRSLRPEQPRASRMALVLELIEHGLMALEVEAAKNKAPAAKSRATK